MCICVCVFAHAHTQTHASHDTEECHESRKEARRELTGFRERKDNKIYVIEGKGFFFLREREKGTSNSGILVVLLLPWDGQPDISP